MTIDQAREYTDLLTQVEAGQGVQVDETSPRKDNAYFKGERVRNAIRKYNLMDADTIKVTVFEIEAGVFGAALSIKE
jgi:hypothetical protein